MDDQRKQYRAWDAQQGSRAVGGASGGPARRRPGVLPARYGAGDSTWSAFHHHYAQELRGQPPFDVTMMVTLLVYAYAVGVCSSRKIAAACERNLAFRAIVGDDARPTSAPSAISARFTGQLAAVVSWKCCVWPARWAWSSSATCPPTAPRWTPSLAAQGHELRLHEQGHHPAESGDRETPEASRADRRRARAALGSRRGDELPAELQRRDRPGAEDSRGESASGSGSPRQGRGRATTPRRGASRAGGRGTKASRQGAGAGRSDADGQGANELHRPGSEDHEADQQGLRLLVQRPGGGGWCGADHRGGRSDQRGQRQAAGGADGPSGLGQRGGGGDRAAPERRTARRHRSRTRRTAAISARRRCRSWRTWGWTRTSPRVGKSTTKPPRRRRRRRARPRRASQEQMLHKLRTAAGQVLYAARKHIVEPVFGQIKSVRGIRAFLLRGLEKVSAEWQLICLTHNLLKIWRACGRVSAR